jgi:hypothetical protein
MMQSPGRLFWCSLAILACHLVHAGQADGPKKKKAEEPEWTIRVDDVGKYLKASGMPKRKGTVIFKSNGKITVKQGEMWIEARYSRNVNSFEMDYVLTGKIKKPQPIKATGRN